MSLGCSTPAESGCLPESDLVGRGMPADGWRPGDQACEFRQFGRRRGRLSRRLLRPPVIPFQLSHRGNSSTGPLPPRNTGHPAPLVFPRHCRSPTTARRRGWSQRTQSSRHVPPATGASEPCSVCSGRAELTGHSVTTAAVMGSVAMAPRRCNGAAANLLCGSLGMAYQSLIPRVSPAVVRPDLAIERRTAEPCFDLDIARLCLLMNLPSASSGPGLPSGTGATSGHTHSDTCDCSELHLSQSYRPAFGQQAD